MNQEIIECGLLHHFMLGNRDYIDYVEADDFISPESQNIFKYILKNKQSSAIEILEALNLKMDYVAEKYQYTLSVSTEWEGVYILVKNSIARKIKNADIKEVAGIASRLDKLNGFYEKGKDKTSVSYLLNSFEENHEKLGFTTGFPKVDTSTKRLKRSHFWVIGGYSNTGKTQYSVQMMVASVEQGAHVLYCSLEMTPEDLMRKIWNYLRIDKAEDQAMAWMIKHEKKIEISKSFELNLIQAQIFSKNYDIVFIDFIQLISMSAKSEYEKMSTIARELQNTSKISDTCIVALSQVSNDFADQNSNNVAKFKGSGDIMNACDVGIILRRDFDKEEKDREGGVSITFVPFYVILRKNRFGTTGKFILDFNTKNGTIS